MVTEALMRGMAPIESTGTTSVSPITGLLVFDSGAEISSDRVADLIDEDD